MKASETPLSFEDLTDILSASEARLRKMRSMSGARDIPVSSFAIVLLDEAKTLHAKKMNVDTVMAAAKAAAERAARTMPAPPTTPFRKDTA